MPKSAQAVAVYDVAEYAKEHAEQFGKAIGTTPRVASKKLRQIAQSRLDVLDVGEKQMFPVPSAAGSKSKVVVLKKLGVNRFSLSVR